MRVGEHRRRKQQQRSGTGDCAHQPTTIRHRDEHRQDADHRPLLGADRQAEQTPADVERPPIAASVAATTATAASSSSGCPELTRCCSPGTAAPERRLALPRRSGPGRALGDGPGEEQGARQQAGEDAEPVTGQSAGADRRAERNERSPDDQRRQSPSGAGDLRTYPAGRAPARAVPARRCRRTRHRAFGSRRFPERTATRPPPTRRSAVRP